MKKVMLVGMISVWAAFSMVAVAQDPKTEKLEHQAVIAAPVDAVWAMFVDPDHMKQWMAPNVDIDLRVGGLIRTNYNAGDGLDAPTAIHNRILSYEPMRMLSMQNVKAPEGFPFGEALRETWSVMQFEPMDRNLTRVRIAGLGWGNDEASQAGRAFFKQGNRMLLDQLKRVLEQEHTAGGQFSGMQTLESMQRLVGTWMHDGEGPNGERFVVRNEVQNAADGQSLVSQGWLGDGEHMMRHGDGLVYLDPISGKVVFHNLNEQGHIATGTIDQISDDEYRWNWTATDTDGSRTAYDIRMIMDDEADTYRFVLTQLPDDGEPVEMIDIEFVRSLGFGG